MQALDLLHTIHNYNNNHSNEFGGNYFSVCKYIALKCIVRYIILINLLHAHTIKALVLCTRNVIHFNSEIRCLFFVTDTIIV